jgi:hypothetical protein
MQDILDEERAEEQRKRDEAERPIREAEAKLSETHRKLYQFEKAEVEAGRPDPGWELPTSAAGLSMSVEEAKQFAQSEGEVFVAEHPEYYASKNNFDAVVRYLSIQGVVIPTRDCFAQAVERLRRFGLLEARPTPAPQLEPVESPEPVELTEAPSSDLVDGFDIQTGEPRRYSQKEIWKMSSADLKIAFRMWTDSDGTDRRAKFNRSRYQ